MTDKGRAHRQEATGCSQAEPEEVSAVPASPPCAFTPCEDRSPVQCALLNALIRRSGGKARVRYFDRADWASLTFTGERHHISMVADMRESLVTMVTGIEDAEFDIPTVIVADIGSGGIKPLGNGQFAVDVEVLTVDEYGQ